MEDAKRKNPHEKEREKISRNNPCPCESGLKYKKCCGKKVEDAIRLRISLSRSVKTKMDGIYSGFYKGIISKEQFLRSIRVDNPDTDTYLYVYNPLIKTTKSEECELLLVEFKESKIILTELLRNGETYRKKKEKDANSSSGN